MSIWVAVDVGEEIAQGDGGVLVRGVADGEDAVADGAAGLRECGSDEREGGSGGFERGEGLGAEMAAGGGVDFLEEDGGGGFGSKQPASRAIWSGGFGFGCGAGFGSDGEDLVGLQVLVRLAGSSTTRTLRPEARNATPLSHAPVRSSARMKTGPAVARCVAGCCVSSAEGCIGVRLVPFRGEGVVAGFIEGDGERVPSSVAVMGMVFPFSRMVLVGGEGEAYARDGVGRQGEVDVVRSRLRAMGPRGVGSAPRAHSRPARSGRRVTAWKPAAVGCDAEHLLHEPGGGSAGPAVGERGVVAGLAVGFEVGVEVLLGPARIVALPEAGGAFGDHASPVLAHPVERFRAVVQAGHGAEHIVAVVGSDGDAGSGRAAHLGRTTCERTRVQMAFCCAGVAAPESDGHGVGLPAGAVGAGGGVEEMVLRGVPQFVAVAR